MLRYVYAMARLFPAKVRVNGGPFMRGDLKDRTVEGELKFFYCDGRIKYRYD